MAKKHTKKTPLPAGSGEPKQTRKDETNDTRRAKALILSALTAGGVFQMNSWQVQAHGNRSSHAPNTTGIVHFSPNDYIVMRAALTHPNFENVNELVTLSSAVSAASATGTADPAKVKELEARKATLTKQLLQQSASLKPLEFVRRGDTSAAIASIEGEGWPERVLGNYLWTLLDIAYLNRQGLETQQDLARFRQIAEPAMAYCQRLLTVIPARQATTQDLSATDRSAEIYHNIASFLTLANNPSAEDVAMARDAAERALKIQTELRDQNKIMRANWMVGEVNRKGKSVANAQKYLQIALTQAQNLKDEPGIAWAQFSLAQVLEQSQPARAKTLAAGARQLAASSKSKDTSMDFLRVELAKGQ